MTNRLAHSTSPYLQQHADNPVDWHEWGPEALALAHRTGKPILLSIGYSACHWCHVMAHESFENAAIADLMNAHFVNIKVDREERPDIDQIYQTAHAMLTQRSGGWPLTMFLTPDTTPFFGGTYFPREPRYGLPGFGDLLLRVAEYHRDHATEIGEQNAQLRQALSRPRYAGSDTGARSFSREPIDAAIRQIADTFDARRGGFTGAPKFPHPEMIEFCLRRFADSGDTHARHMACLTLEKMCRGGIFDQLGGGFARYSVDAEWAIPHFEKMLYDNGPLLRLLADAWQVAENDSQQALFSRRAHETMQWLLREMQSPAGGYYSTLDADSEGHEGKFYVWSREEVKALLTEDEWLAVELHFGFDQRPNFENVAWNPVMALTVGDVAARLSLPFDVCDARLAQAREKLFAAREKRIHPGRDEKVLTSWNALMIEGVAHAARVFGCPDWLESARRALDFLRTTMWDATHKRLRATHKDGLTRLNAYLDDYAFLIKAILAMLEADFREDDLRFAQELADVLLAQFEDAETGGFFFTSHDHETLIQRPKPAFDNATPSGNGVAAFALQRLAHLTGETRYALAAERTLAAFYDPVQDHPSGHASLLMALEEWLVPPELVVVDGPANEHATFRAVLAERFRPATLSIFIAGDTTGMPPPLRHPGADSAQAWVCRGTSCLPPINDPAELRATLKTPIV